MIYHSKLVNMFTPMCNIHNYDTWKSSEYNLSVDFMTQLIVGNV